MKRIFTFLLLSLVMLGGCKREVPTAEVTFVVSETSGATPSFGIEYTHDQAGGTAVASNNDNSWGSGKIVLQQGQFISLKTTCTDPQFDLALSIFINGNLWKTGEMHNPTSSVTISGNVPAD